MREKLIAFVVFITFIYSSIAQYNDNFSDGNYTSNPTWGNGDFADFEVLNSKLHLNAVTIADRHLSIFSQAIENASWEFLVRMDFNPSSSNLSRVYLVSNNSNLASSLNGYYISLGGTDDEVSLFRQDGTTSTKIIDGVNGFLNVDSVNTRVKVTRDASGNWNLFLDTTGGSSYTPMGSVFDNTHISSYYSGVLCKFTSTRADKFYFDDFIVTGSAQIDNTAPQITSVSAINSTQIDVLFSENISPTSAQNISNYSINNGIGNPSLATIDGTNGALVHLTLNTAMTSGTSYSLSASNIQDLSSNTLVSQSRNFVYFFPVNSTYRDIVINEILADPSPVIGLPNSEYVELYNASNNYYDLANWIITDGTSSGTMSSYILGPNEYVILFSSNNESEFLFYTNKLAVASFPSLTNGGDLIEIYNENAELIDRVEYSSSWHQSTVKADGGWALEQVNPSLPCENSANWLSSINSIGGTPGTQNSVFSNMPDITLPSIISTYVSAKDTVNIVFSESLDISSLISTNFSINGVSILNLEIISNKEVNLITSDLDTGVFYTLLISNLSDCSGNTTNLTKSLILAHSNMNARLFINEVLFNPTDAGVDFVEIYNHSDKYIDLKNWILSNDPLGTTSNNKIVQEGKVIAPNSYLVLTTDSAIVKQQYRHHGEGVYLQMESFPSYSNTEGNVYLLNPLNETHDYFRYNEKFHFSLLTDVDGVSLERISFTSPTNDSSNWHSAAENIGFASPGLKNSQFYQANLGTATISIDPEIFSPDNDGYQDILTIGYELNEPGYVGNLMIYDNKGRMVRYLVKNELLSTSGLFVWDGVVDENRKADVGIYVLFFEIFNSKGEITRTKKTVVVGSKF